MLLYKFVFWSTLLLIANGRPSNDVFKIRISGGELTIIEEHPYIVAMYRGKFYNACSGSIIAKNLIVTAAHCISDDFAKEVIRSGSSYQVVNGTLHHIVSYVRHENYGLDYSNNGKVSVNDIAIAKVEPPFEFDATRRPISLFNVNEVIKVGSIGVISGWGSVPHLQTVDWSLEDKYLNRLKSVNVPIYEKSVCAAEHLKHRNYTLKPGQMCAGSDRGSCRGDSGGPLVVDGRLAAIVSWGYGCGGKGFPPTVYTEIAYFRKWVDEQAKKLTGQSLTNNEVTTSTNKLEFHDGQNYYGDRPVWF